MEVQRRESTCGAAEKNRAKGDRDGGKKTNRGYIHKDFRKRRIRRVREFNERIPTDRGNRTISTADQIAVWAAGATPLLAEEEEEEEKSRCLVL